MGTSKRKEREKEKRRNDIIDAAEKIFFSKGITLATMDDIAEFTELSKGTLYLYFKNKEELYFAINSRGLKILSGLFEEIYSRNIKGIDKVIELGKAYVLFYKNYRNYFDTLIFCSANEPNFKQDSISAIESHQYGEKTLNILSTVINMGIIDKSIRKDIDPLKMAFVLWGQITGLMQIISAKQSHLKANHNIMIDDLIQFNFDFIRDGMKE